jgi:predicted glycoside hydrolase/deacetylase ChbG (UPF0249 family)
MTRHISICIDDFGQHAGINAAALQLVALGRVHAVGCLVGGSAMPGTASAVAEMVQAGADVGLHLDFTEFPLLPQSLHSLPQIIVQSYLRRLNRQQVRTEICAQLDAFEAITGRQPVFVDGHQHIHQLPTVRNLLMEELARRYGSYRPWIRSTRSGGGAGRERFKPWVIESLGASAMAALCRKGGYPQNTRLLGVYNFQGGVDTYRRLLAGWLAQARSGDLLMCHPSAPCTAADGLLPARVAELEVLAGPDFASLLQQADVRLGPVSAHIQRILPVWPSE